MTRMAEQATRLPQIMVVDDDADTVAILAHHLQRAGFVAIEAVSGAECLRLARENPVDVILLDLMMPEMDGFQVCRGLKENPGTAEFPVTMTPARDAPNARAEGMRLGVSDFLAKPVFRRQLANRIRAQLEATAASHATEAALKNFEQPRREEEK